MLRRVIPPAELLRIASSSTQLLRFDGTLL